MRFKELLAAGEVLKVFGMARIPHHVVVDLFGLAGGYHGYWLDQEHGGLTYEQMGWLSVAARANGMDTFVRMPPTDYARVTQAYEAGAGGVMAARIESLAQAEQFVQWAKFGPRGQRGFNVGGRDADYTHKSPARFAEDANRTLFVAIQIETREVLPDIDAIAALDGVDLLFVGPSDLSQAFGVTGQLDHPEVWNVVAQVSAACKKHGKNWGTVPASPAFADRCVEEGCRMLLMGNDVMCLRRGIAAVQESYSRFFPNRKS